MPIDFTLRMEQKRLQADARAFARDVLTKVGPATRGLPTPLARFAAPFVTGQGAPLASFCFSEPGGSANFAAPRPAEGVRTVARRANGDDASDWIITGAKKWASSATGWDGRGADLMTVVCRTDPNAPPERAISVIAVTGPAPGVMLERAIDSIGHRAPTARVPAQRGTDVGGQRHRLRGRRQGPGRGLLQRDGADRRHVRLLV